MWGNVRQILKRLVKSLSTNTAWELLPMLKNITGSLSFDLAPSGLVGQKSNSLPENSTKCSIMKYFDDELKQNQILPENRKGTFSNSCYEVSISLIPKLSKGFKQKEKREVNFNVRASQVPASAGDTRDTGSIPGSGRSPGVRNGNPLKCSCLKNSMDRRAWQATVHGITKNQTWLSTAQPQSQHMKIVAQELKPQECVIGLTLNQ